ILLVFLIFLSIGIGAVSISPQTIFSIIGDKLGLVPASTVNRTQEAILWVIRLPRVVLAILVGAALGISGASIQGIFRNPLAAPDLIGISGGAAFFAAGMIVFQHSLSAVIPAWLGAFLLPFAAFLGGVVATI